MITNLKYKTGLWILTLGVVASLIMSCAKNNTLAEDPYAGGKQVLDITFISKTVDQEVVQAGDILVLQVEGLMKYENNFQLFVNEIEADILNYSDSTIRFQVPLQASTGSVWITAKGQTFFGPIVKIGGKVSVDATFKIVNGAGKLSAGGTATVFDIEQLPSGRFWVGGAFDNFELKGTEEKPNGGIAQLSPEGEYITNDIDFGMGVVGGSKTIYSISRINSGSQNGKYIIGGNFTAYNSRRTNRQTLNNIARLNSNGTLDTMVTEEIVNPKPEEVWKDKDTIPTFNAGVDGTVRKTFIFGEQIYILGNFQQFKRIYYPYSTYDEKVYDVTRMRQMVRVNMDGTLDSTFHYNKQKRESEIGGNGAITDATMQSDGKLILVGNFTTFNGVAANRIVRLNLDGSVDNTFNAGAGADGDIYSVRLNPTTNKIVVAGTFTNFNGKASSGVALLNNDGSNDANFVGKQISGGSVTFAGQLNNGKIIVSGAFSTYGDYLRQGFMILESNGDLAEGYNNTGGFEGRIYDMIEESVSGGVKVTFVGDIYRFNAMLPKNVLRIVIAN
jgi:hypothetical protein